MKPGTSQARHSLQSAFSFIKKSAFGICGLNKGVLKYSSLFDAELMVVLTQILYLETFMTLSICQIF